MKILQVNAYYGYGSTGRMVQEIEKKGTESQLEMYSVYWLLRNKKIENEKVIYCGRDGEEVGFRKIMQWVFNGGKLSYNSKMTENILKVIKKIDPDIIHLHNLHGDFEYGMLDIPLFFQALAAMKKKVIWTLHDCWPITGRCYYFSYKNCEKWRTGCGNCPQRLFDREGIFYDYSHKNWQTKKDLYQQIDDLTIVTVSNWLKDVVESSILKERKTITIYNGIDTEIYQPYDTLNKKERYQILCIGWDRRKGYKDYYRLSKILKTNEEILVVGKRPLFRRLRKMPRNMKEIPRVNDLKKMAEIYNKADVYFNASPAETFGLTTAEAMACGTPVVGYDVTATPEIIGYNEGCGYVAPVGNVKEIARYIQLIKEKSDRQTETCRERVITCFQKKEMLNNYIKLYNEFS